MGDLNTGETFASGQTLTPSRLNNHVAAATVKNDAIQYDNLDAAAKAAVIAAVRADLAANGLPADSLGSAYPVGSVFIHYSTTDPATLLGFGTWALLGEGRTLVCRAAADADFDTIGETGGSKDAVLVEHSHDFRDVNLYSTTDNPPEANIQHLVGSPTSGTLYNWAGTPPEYLTTEGESATGKNLPPYIVVSIWRRTA